jgi:hypothetical protein
VADQPALTWTRSERPDGHRSLWFLAARWINIEVAVRDTVKISHTIGHFFGDSPGKVRRVCRALECPTPTADDLAWLRGAA